MPKYIRKPVEVEAVQWFKMGDHPNVDDESPSFTVRGCHTCGSQDRHGWLWGSSNNGTVCPSDWVITDPNGEVSVVSDKLFREMYEEAE